jgi:hypothetical protein
MPAVDSATADNAMNSGSLTYQGFSYNEAAMDVEPPTDPQAENHLS